MKQKVKLSERGWASLRIKQPRDREGLFVRRGKKDSDTVYVIWEGSKTPIGYHKDYIEFIPENPE